MSDQIVGYVALFNSETVIAGLFRERILPGAFKDTIARDDIRASFNHNLDHLLGRRSSGTLALKEDTKGLRYVITLNTQDPDAMSVAAKIARRDVTGSSFWFAIDSEHDEEWTNGERGQLPLRTLRRLRLIEAGPVALPAYGDTAATFRDSIAERDRLHKLIQCELLHAKIDNEKAWRVTGCR